MAQSIRFFGGTTHGCVTLENGHTTTLAIDRELWFDRDIDGRWLVWAGPGHPAALPADTDRDDDTGAIVVRDPGTIAFIELLGELFANPARFHDEPLFVVPTDDASS